MFIASVNAACINAPFIAPTIAGMHESMERLLSFARDATKSLPVAKRVSSFADLGERLQASSAVMTNWKARGLSKDGALLAEREFGCSAVYLLDGVGGAEFRRIPLSAEVLDRIAAADVDERQRVENTLRGYFGLPAIVEKSKTAAMPLLTAADWKAGHEQAATKLRLQAGRKTQRGRTPVRS